MGMRPITDSRYPWPILKFMPPHDVDMTFTQSIAMLHPAATWGPMMTPRESDPTFHRPRNAAAATRAAAGPDAQPPLVMAPADGGAVRVHRPGRLGRLRRGPSRDAERAAPGPPGGALPGRGLPAPAARRRGRPARLHDRPALVPVGSGGQC